MNKKTSINTAVSVLLVTFVFCSSSFAQAHKAGGSRKLLQVKRMRTLGPRYLVETPQYNTDASRGKADPQKWQQITVQYSTAPLWIDELSIQFYALAVTRDEKTGKNVLSLYKLNVKYVDIAQGRDHKATVFLRPTALKRYGDVFAVAAVFTVDGKVVAETSESTNSRLPKDWWKNQQVMGRPDMVVRNGYLLNRSKTPWAFINYDDYEVIK